MRSLFVCDARMTRSGLTGEQKAHDLSAAFGPEECTVVVDLAILGPIWLTGELKARGPFWGRGVC